MRIYLGCLQLAVSQKTPDLLDADTLFQQVGGYRVAQKIQTFGFSPLSKPLQNPNLTKLNIVN
jgi:hypothetical protein